MSDDQFNFEEARVDPFDPNKPYYDPGNQEWLRRRMEQSMIQRGVDPIQARKESMEAMNTLARINKDDFDKRTRG